VQKEKNGVWLVLLPLTSIKNEGKIANRYQNSLHYFTLSANAEDNLKIFPNFHVFQSFILGAFLIPYLLFLTFGGVPIFFLEQCVGQFTQSEPVHAWNKLCPLLRGKGVSSFNQYTVRVKNTALRLYSGNLLSERDFKVIMTFFIFDRKETSQIRIFFLHKILFCWNLKNAEAHYLAIVFCLSLSVHSSLIAPEGRPRFALFYNCECH